VLKQRFDCFDSRLYALEHLIELLLQYACTATNAVAAIGAPIPSVHAHTSHSELTHAAAATTAAAAATAMTA
jgi:hypothetical protein